MFENTIDKIVELAQPVILADINGLSYSSKPIHPVLDPMPSPLVVHTLTGLSQYITINIDKLDLFNGLMIHVQTPTHVVLLAALSGDFKQRATYLTAKAAPPVFRFNDYYPVEEFIIALQSMFCSTPGLNDLLRVVGNLKDESSVRMADDGVTQQVTVKTGITRVEEVAVENPVVLKPYRSFLEIEQPKGRYIFRIKKGKDNIPWCALFDAEGGMWQLEAMRRIGEWLKENVMGVAIMV